MKTGSDSSELQKQLVVFPEVSKMLGWMIVFAMLAVSAAAAAMTGSSAAVSVGPASVVFATLFLVGLLTRALRGKSW
jgi:uncharacterized membrane protein YtjA (UPF0391 family)